MQPVHPFRHRGADQGADHRLRERPVEREVGLGDAGGGREAALVGGVVAAERPDVVQVRASQRMTQSAGREVRSWRCLRSWRRTPPRRDPGGSVSIRSILLENSPCSFFATPAGNEDAEVTDAFMDGVDDGLAVGADLVDALVQIEDPAERLLRRRDVVALRAEHHDRRADIAQVDRGAVRGLESARRRACCR